MSIKNVKKTLSKPLLAKDEETALLERIKAGDTAARDKLVEHNCRLVVPVVKRYAKSGIPFDDLYQEGCAGLVIAADKFDMSKNVWFSTYATNWITQRISRYAKKHGKNVFVPEHVVNLAGQLGKARAALENDGVEPTCEQLAVKYRELYGKEATPDMVREALAACQTETSLSAKIGDDDKSEFGDLIEDEEAVDPAQSTADAATKTLLGKVMSGLSPQEKDLIRFRYGVSDGTTLSADQLAEKFGVTAEDVGKACADAMVA